MRKNIDPVIRMNRLTYAVAVAISVMATNIAAAQESKTAAPEVAVNTDVQQVLIVGARASQQSSIERKKHAPTAMDSIVAEDVGSFPDRNVGEAISRIAGIALERGDFGEGINVSVRGNGAELTRVEIDGQAVQSGLGTDLLGGGDGRGVEFREMSSDLIKSVDVVKGSTADMVEGSLGGGIIIKTRTGLDFKKPYYSLRLGATAGSLNNSVTPNLNLVVADKFLDNRLGVLVNLNRSVYSNEAHALANGGSSQQQGALRLIDFDNSPQKTFTYNPAALSQTDPSVNKPFLVSPLSNGGNITSTTPMQLLTKSAAAQSKADCYAAFPALTSAQSSAVVGTNPRAAALNQRQNELITCLNQWNDYTPSIIRNYVKSQEDTRNGGDLRLDFKVNNALSVYAKLSRNTRSVDDIVGNFTLGSVNVNANVVDTGNVRTALPGSGYYTFPTTYSFKNNTTGVSGATANVMPGYTVDDTHHVTSYTVTDGNYSTDMIFSKVNTTSDYFQTGGIYKSGDLKIEFLVGDARSTAQRYDRRANFSYPYGQATFSLLPNGAWSFTLPPGSTNDQLNYDMYAKLSPQTVATAAVPVSASNTVAVPAYTVAQKPLLTPATTLTVIRVRQTETEEKTAKADLTFNLHDRVPYFTSIKSGFNFRATSNTFWGLGSATIQDQVGTFGQPGYVAGIYLPGLGAKSSVVGCQDTPGSLAPGGQKCAYGYNPSTNPQSLLFGQTVLTQAQYLDLVKQSLSVPPSGQFFGGAKDRPAGLIDGWTQIDMDKLYQLAGIPTNLNCIVRCTASDGKVYDQPVSKFNEKSYAGYFMADFNIDHLPFSKNPLPWGIELSGNLGVRVVKTNVIGTGQMTFTSITENGNYEKSNPTAPGGTDTFTVRKNTSIQADTTDVMPIYNLALWAVPNTVVVRYNQAKTIARPGMSRLLPSGTCIYDQTIPDRLAALGITTDGSDGDQRCTGTMGNPGVQAFTNINRNLSIEWYPNKDTMFSVAAFRQKGVIGAPNLIVPVSKQLFAGSNAVDPASGVKLADLTFDYNQWQNQPPSTRRGLEFATKTAFTFLPSVLRFTGFDGNYTRVRSSQGVPNMDLYTGQVLPVINEPKYSYNASLWYDDGRFTARVALQVVAPRYQCYAPCTNTSIGVNNFPVDGGVSSVRLPYNPGLPIWSDMTRFVDAKMAYKFKNNMEVFIEGRNITNAHTTTSTGGDAPYSDGIPMLYSDNFPGRRIMVGLNIRSNIN